MQDDCGLKISDSAAGSLEVMNGLTKYQGDLAAFIISLMPGHPDAKDVLQKTNLTIWKKQDKYTPGTNFRAWMFTVARFEVRAHFKTLRRQPCFVFDETLLDQLTEDALFDETPELERLQALEGCLAKLRKEDRELLDFRYRQTGGLENYAVRLGRTVSALSFQLFHLRASLRKCISRKLSTEKVKS